MKKTAIIALTTVMIGGAGLIGCNRNDTAGNSTDTRTPGEKTGDAVANAGQKAGDAIGSAVDKTKDGAKTAGDKISNAAQPSADEAMTKTRDVLTSTIQAAVSKDGFGDVVNTLSKADRDRIGKLDKATLGDLNTAIDKFRADWKGKFNEDFKLSDKEQMVFAGPVKIDVGSGFGEARMASDKSTPAATGSDKSANNLTTVTFPASRGAPLINVSIQNEGTLMNSYKIDIPDTVDSNKLRDNLTKHITDVDNMKADWPADKNEAYRAVAQHILAAITDAH